MKIKFMQKKLQIKLLKKKLILQIYSQMMVHHLIWENKLLLKILHLLLWFIFNKMIIQIMLEQLINQICQMRMVNHFNYFQKNYHFWKCLNLKVDSNKLRLHKWNKHQVGIQKLHMKRLQVKVNYHQKNYKDKLIKWLIV